MNRVSIFSADLSRTGLALISGLLVLACGCGTSTESAPAGAGGGSGGTGVSFGGKVMAGSQPVSGAALQLYAAGSTGYGSAGTTLLTGALTTNSGGGFTVPAGYGNSMISLLSPSGSAVNGSTAWGSGQLALPVAVAVDASHNAWVANQSSSTITRISADGSNIAQISCCNGASGVAVDQGGNVWVSNYFGSSISEVSRTGAVLLNGQSGGGVDHPQAIAIDGAGRVWVGNFHAGTLSEFAGSTAAMPGTPLSPATGLGTDAQLGSPFAIAVDQSGNLWVTNSNGSNTVTVFIGLASPVKTPLLGPPQLT